MALVGDINDPGSGKSEFPRNHHRKRLINHLSSRSKASYYNHHASIHNLALDHSPFLYRLKLMKKLPVHMGCVNTISWNKTGEYILSGSDDCNLCITKPTYMFDESEDYTVLQKIQTRHLGNIFSARFLPYSNDEIIVSCSSDGPVIVTDINSENPSQGVFNFNCHSSTIFEIKTLPDYDKVFLSCGEDKTIRLFDLRCHRSCARAGTCPHPAVIRNSHAMTTLSIHPLNSNLLLVGRADGIALVYDRRKLPDVSQFSREKAHAEYLANQAAGRPSGSYKYLHPLHGVVSQFSVQDMEEKCRFTSLCYSSSGEQVLASYSQDYVYLFNTDKSSNFELIQTLPRTFGNLSSDTDNNNLSSDTSERSHSRVSRTPRIRVRGDWSDTGVNSVPMSTRLESEPSLDRPSFLQRMTEVARSLSARRGNSRMILMNELISRPINYLVTDEASSEANDLRDQEEENDTAENTEDEMETEDINEENVPESNGTDDDDDEDDDDDDDGYSIDANDTLRVEFVECKDHKNQSSKEKQSNGSTKSKISKETKLKFKRAVDDFKTRYNAIPSYQPRIKYQGHRNSRTFIKKAVFWGDSYIMSGSDCGRIMVWEKDTAKLVMGFPADERVVNCLAPNPHHYALASSGIDHDIKIWSTQSMLESPLKLNQEELNRIVRNNELMLAEAKQTIAVPPHLFFRVLASYAQNRLR